MNQNEIMEMANKASKEWLKELPSPEETANPIPKRFLEIFAKLVAAKAIAELESQEPVEPTEKIYKAWEILVGQHKDLLEENEKLRNQSQRTWVGLTDEEIDAAWGTVAWYSSKGLQELRREYARGIEAKLKEKNI
jgi:hypothetical protein